MTETNNHDFEELETDGASDSVHMAYKLLAKLETDGASIDRHDEQFAKLNVEASSPNTDRDGSKKQKTDEISKDIGNIEMRSLKLEDQTDMDLEDHMMRTLYYKEKKLDKELEDVRDKEKMLMMKRKHMDEMLFFHIMAAEKRMRAKRFTPTPVNGSGNDGEVPQTSPLNDRQVQNNAGGYGYKIDDIARLKRFLCIGSEGGTYYVKPKDLARENIASLSRLLEAGRGDDVIEVIKSFANGRVAKMNPLILTLATCASQSKNLKTKRDAYKSLSAICTIPTHLFMFMEYYQNMKQGDDTKGKGWGRAHRIGIANWYLHYKDNPYKLALHVTKYRQRNNWSHRDVMRMCHPKPDSDRGSVGLAAVIRFVVKGLGQAKESYLKEDSPDDLKKIFDFLTATETAKSLNKKQVDEACILIEKHNLVREHLPTEMLNDTAIWKALLPKMPMNALIRNLGKMTNIELLKQGTPEAEKACEKLTNEFVLKQARIHPFNVLVALTTYRSGHGDKSAMSWNANPDITRSLEEAFYKSFKNVEATGKRILLALDISGSMGCGQINGCNILPREGAAAMAMVTARTERQSHIVGFSHDIINLNINSDMSLAQVVEELNRHPFGSTDCARPMTWATQRKKEFDVFIVYTDSETWSGQVHVTEALKRYRDFMGTPDIKLIVVALTSNGFSLADPEDRYMLDVVGFDADAPEIIRNFILGKI